MTAVSIHQNHSLVGDFADGTPWPLLTGYGHEHEVLLDGVGLVALAQEFGTPLQVISESEVRERAAEYRRAFAGGAVAYASKAFLTSTMARWMMDEGLDLDVCSGGELALAGAAGVPMDRILMHGNAKSPQELSDAHRSGVGRIVVDSRTEISQLAALGHSGDGHRRQKVLLRVLPGVSGHTHRSVDTGREDQQFGFSLSSGAALEAVRRVLSHSELELAGLHCHIGSQIADPEAYLEAARRMIALMAHIRDVTGVVLPELDLGGGHAVAYRAGDPELAPGPLAAALRETIDRACLVNRFPLPRMTIEPGRAIVARAGVTLYRVITVKRTADGALFVAVDGGMSDNPRPSLYHASYTVRLIGRATHQGAVPATVVGRHCEAGDVLVQDAELPADIRPGDLLVMLCTGAYQHSMASNYNMVRRSPVVSVRGGRAQVLIRRETDDDLMRRDLGLAGN
ncbi:diaminopimelate decarboxylase [Nakamurella sp. PAMC28650]|uniref:diaminopimelate decarboxylase n=1 Tax=Nakamurella sp. PAMC28650 TaxID=2762325 RepID=UPI001C9B90E3|nr:diaminopimelate decarboxylase [Nakamurella sp. PAMC28650]